MNQGLRKHVSPWIAWSIIGLMTGMTCFATQWLLSDTGSIYENMSTPITISRTPNTGKIATDTTTADWQSYTNTQYSFTIKYPKDWTYKENSSNSTNEPVVSFISPETAKLPEENESPARVDISIYYHNSINDVYGNNSTKSDSLEVLMSNKSYFPEGYTKITFAGQTSYEGSEAGMGSYYTINTEKNGHIYKIFFDRKATKSELSSTEKLVLSTFQFTN